MKIALVNLMDNVCISFLVQYFHEFGLCKKWANIFNWSSSQNSESLKNGVCCKYEFSSDPTALSCLTRKQRSTTLIPNYNRFQIEKCRNVTNNLLQWNFISFSDWRSFEVWCDSTQRSHRSDEILNRSTRDTLDATHDHLAHVGEYYLSSASNISVTVYNFFLEILNHISQVNPGHEIEWCHLLNDRKFQTEVILLELVVAHYMLRKKQDTLN